MSQTLSENDRLIFSRVFESHPATSFQNSLVDPLLPRASRSLSSLETLEDLQSQEFSAIAYLNADNPFPEILNQIVNRLTDIIQSHPNYSSAYNNRAQALRLIHGDDLHKKDVGDSTIWNDLCTAINLESPEQANYKVSDFQARVLRAAYAQRGYLTWKAAKLLKKGLENTGALPKDLRGLTQCVMEDMARADLEMAGRYGDQESMKMAVSANPYARLCGNIVQKAMRAEIENMNVSINVKNL